MKVLNLKKSIWNDYILMITLITPLISIGFITYFFCYKRRQIGNLHICIINPNFYYSIFIESEIYQIIP